MKQEKGFLAFIVEYVPSFLLAVIFALITYVVVAKFGS